jgi:hypothetical protein
MTLPNKTDLSTLDTVYLGQPFNQVEAKNLGTKSLNTVYLGQPFVASVSSNVYVNVGGSWKQASNVYVNVGGVWKNTVNDQLNVNASGTWKT